MTRNDIYFCWERAMTGNWAPVCYHGERPKDEKVSEGDRPSRTQLHPVPDDCRDDAGNPLFGKLASRFRMPGGEE